MNNELSKVAIMALAGGAIAGISYIAGKREGSTIGKGKADIMFTLGRCEGFINGYELAKQRYNVFNKDNQEGK